MFLLILKNLKTVYKYKFNCWLISGFNFGGQPIPTAPAPNEFTHSETFQPVIIKILKQLYNFLFLKLFIQQRAPPPSYEESQKIMNFNHLQQHQQAIPTYPPPNYGIATAATSYQGTLPQYRSPQRTYTAVTTTQIKSSIPKV